MYVSFSYLFVFVYLPLGLQIPEQNIIFIFIHFTIYLNFVIEKRCLQCLHLILVVAKYSRQGKDIVTEYT